VEAASAASQAGAYAVLYSGEDVLPYYRPRVIAMAFGQVDPAGAAMHNAAWYSSRGIELRLSRPVRHLNSTAMEITDASGSVERFDSIVIATGATASSAPFPVEVSLPVFKLWTVGDAAALRAAMRSGIRLVIIGGGLIGIETALRAADYGAEVIIVELMDRLLAAFLSPRGSVVLHSRLMQKGIRIECGRRIKAVVKTESGSAMVQLEDGTAVGADMVVLAAGSRRDVLFVKEAGLATGWGVIVDGKLATSQPGIFACGDVAQSGPVPRSSASIAAAQGRCAGANAVAIASGSTAVEFRQRAVAVSLSCCGFDVQMAGEKAGDGAEEDLLDGNSDAVYRACAVRDGKVIGVQMVGTALEFRKYAAMLGV